MRIVSALGLLLFAVSVNSVAVVPAANQIELVEFYNQTLDHFFVTTTAKEISDLDTGVHVGWARTGYRFPVVKIGAPQPATTPTCRFYGRPEAKIDSHFYSSKLAECEDVKLKFPNEWQFEAEEVFRAFAVNPETGQCPIDTSPVYRLWNQRPDVNHRYTDQLSVYLEMVAKGYKAEGDGNPLQPVAFCQPTGGSVIPPPPAGSPACTLAAPTSTPAIGTTQTITATCTGAPTSYTWIGCTSTGLPNTCQATRATAGAANYSLRATNTQGTGAPATMTLTWGGVTGPVPQCTISATTQVPTAGSTITLSANCNQSPTRYEWLSCHPSLFPGCAGGLIPGCSATANTCSVSQGTAGFARYEVRGINNSGTGANAAVEVEWKGGSGGGGGGGGGGSAPSCVVYASDQYPPLGTNLQLTASCTNNPTTFSWGGLGVSSCSSTQSVCSFMLNTAGPQTYTLVGGNAYGSSAQATVSVNWGGSSGPPVPVCTLSSSLGLTPTVGQTAVLTASCSNAPTSYVWASTCVSTTSTCSDTVTALSGLRSYTVTASNAAGPGVPANITLNWQPAPTAAPTCSISSSNSSPFTGQSITLTANCTQSPTSYAWTNCSSINSTCTTTATVAGPQTYGVTGSNALFGAGAPASLMLNWTQSTGGQDFCGAYSNVRTVAMPWGTPATGGLNPIYTAAHGGFANDGVFVVSFVAQGGPYSTVGNTSFAEYAGASIYRSMTLSKSSCDFRQIDPTGASGPFAFLEAGPSASISFNVGGAPYNLVAGTTYYFNFRNYVSIFGLGNTCPNSTCNAIITVNFPK